ncbi:hypothetical protein [Leptospira jelokensis]|uniref:PIN domain-containing protein n=1 Tax=Leptospira jelokensis TaxID=2484931 RepID=A0A4Z0ZX25_9LEPT|nr:hypothetical protein [Leptospira jelokensis]TGL75556.1 hypothetical protein EHQ62_01630 [Leptospira jelokensis]
MKLFLDASFLEALIRSERKNHLMQILLGEMDSFSRFFTSAHSIHLLLLSLGNITLEQKRMILRNIEDLTDGIFSVSMDEIRSELLLAEGLGLEQVIALSQGMDVFYECSKKEKPSHPLLQVRNFFGETE